VDSLGTVQRRQSFFPAISGEIILTDNGIWRMGPSAGHIYIPTLLAHGPMIEIIYCFALSIWADSIRYL
jgi:hypothetical protein